MLKSGPIVLVDDDEEDQDIVKEALRDSQVYYPVLSFRNGLEVLEYLRTTSDHPFLILCDINMPRMNGFELREEILRDLFLARKSIPFIYLSTSGSRFEVEKAYELMVQGFIIKPSSYEKLKDVIKMIIDYWQLCRRPSRN
jgi:CheY-like chemotaxis protein